jgi:hypothetical protein
MFTRGVNLPENLATHKMATQISNIRHGQAAAKCAKGFFERLTALVAQSAAVQECDARPNVQATEYHKRTMIGTGGQGTMSRISAGGTK